MTTLEKCRTCKHAFTTGKDRWYCKKSLADKDDCGEYDMAIKALEQEPCEDTVSRKEIIEHYTTGEMANVHHIDKNHLLAFVEQLPSARPQEQTGHWIGIDEEPHEDYECDKCGYVVSTYTANIEPHTEYKYCPNCGARMVEPQESEE